MLRTTYESLESGKVLYFMVLFLELLSSNAGQRYQDPLTPIICDSLLERRRL